MIAARGTYDCVWVHSKSQELYSIFRLLCVATETKAAANLAVIFFSTDDWLMQLNSLEIHSSHWRAHLVLNILYVD